MRHAFRLAMRWLYDWLFLVAFVVILAGAAVYLSRVFMGVPPPGDAKALAEVTRDLGQALAWLGAAVFFGYKAWSGYFVVNLSIKVECVRRSRAAEADDLLQVTLVLAKGDRGSVRLHDAQIRVTPEGGAERIIVLDDFKRLGSVYESHGTLKRGTVEWKAINPRIPLLNLTPGEATHFACWCPVPANAPCRVEAVVLGKRKAGMLLAQWRASCVSLPEMPPSAAARETQ